MGTKRLTQPACQHSSSARVSASWGKAATLVLAKRHTHEATEHCACEGLADFAPRD